MQYNVVDIGEIFSGNNGTLQMLSSSRVPFPTATCFQYINSIQIFFRLFPYAVEITLRSKFHDKYNNFLVQNINIQNRENCISWECYNVKKTNIVYKIYIYKRSFSKRFRRFKEFKAFQF